MILQIVSMMFSLLTMPLESTQASPYANAGITLATRNGYVSAMAYSETYDWLFVPAETLGDTALPVGDYFYQGAASPGYKDCSIGR